MAQYIIRRFVGILFTLLLLSIFTFTLSRCRAGRTVDAGRRNSAL